MGSVTVSVTDSAGNTATQQLTYAVSSSLPLQTPYSAQKVHQNYGVCQHVNFQSTVYQHQDALIDILADAGVHRFRSMYANNLSNHAGALAKTRARNMKWHALIMTTTSDRAQVDARINHIANNAIGVVDRLEGINEPNEGSGWAAATALRQYWMHVAVRKNAKLRPLWLAGAFQVGSPSMHDVKLDNSNGQHWVDFGETLVTCDMDDPDYPAINGVAQKIKAKNFCDFVNAHGYQGASVPDKDRGKRVAYARAVWPNAPIVFSECGYTNAVGVPASSRTTGHKVIPEHLSAIYDAQFVFDWYAAGLGCMRYEALDDPPSDSVPETQRYDQESTFGLIGVQTVTGNPSTTWREKPGLASIKQILTWLKDEGASYNTQPVRLSISSPSSTVRTFLVQKRSGDTRLYYWKYAEVWDPNAEVPKTVSPESLRIEDAAGVRNVTVIPTVQYVDIRR